MKKVKYKMVRGLIGRSGVYGIKLNGMVVYVGSSGSCMESRYSHHLTRLRQGTHSNKRLQELFNRYYESFEFFVIEYCKAEHSLALEKHYMEVHEDTAVNNNGIKCTIKHMRTDEESRQHSQMLSKLNRGTNNPNSSKLNEQKVKEILWLKDSTELKQHIIADLYKVSNGYVSAIGKTRWQHIHEKVKPTWFDEWYSKQEEQTQ